MNGLTPSICLQSVMKSYDARQVIKNVSFETYPGSIVSLLGVNGAGKTTLIKMMLGLLKPTEGRIYLNGQCPTKVSARRNVGVVPQVSDFVDELTPRETIHLISKHYESSKAIQELIDLFSLYEIIDKRIAFLSEGQKRRLALALAFVGNPKIVFLDEPTVGLDIQSRLKLWEFVKSYRQLDTTIILTTHYLEEAQALSDRFLILHDGKIVVDKAQINHSSLEELFLNLLKEQNPC